MSKAVKTYVLLVDWYRRPERQRNTAGSYLVGAKTPKEAAKLLKQKIKFGSVQVVGEYNSEISMDKGKEVGYKEIVKQELRFKETPEDGKKVAYIVRMPARSATDPLHISTKGDFDNE